MKFPSLSQPADTALAKPDSDAEGTLELSRVFAALRRRVLLILGVTTAVAAAAGLRTFLSPPTYTAQFEVLIQPSSAEVEAIASTNGVPISRNERTLSLADQTRILTSPEVLAPVVKTIQSKHPEICSFSEVLVRSQGDPCYNYIRSNLSIKLTERKTAAEEESRIFTVLYSGASEEEVERVADLVSKTFLDYGLASRKRDIQQGLDFLDTKLPDVRSQVNQLQRSLQTLRQNNNLVTPEAKGDQLNAQIRQFQAEYLSVQVDLEEAVSLLEDLQAQQQQQNQEFVASPVLSNNARYQALVQELLKLDSQIAEASTLFLDGSPDLQVLQEQRQNLVNMLAREGMQVQQELMSRIRSLETRQAALSDTLSSLEADTDQLAGVSRQFTDIELELKIATENLNRLLERREALQIEAAQRELPWELVTPPQVIENVASLPTNVALGVVLGLLLGVGLALTIDTAKDKLYTPSDLKRLTPLPILGLIPHYDWLEPEDIQQDLAVSQVLVVGGLPERPVAPNNGSAHYEDRHGFQEAFRSLMANIRQIDGETPLKSIVVSSAEPQEGKSTVAAYLAQAAAAMGDRVLLIDADLRSPQLHEFFGLPNTVGVVNLLTKEFYLHDVVQRSSLEPNLFVLTAGTTLADPVRLLSVAAIQQLMAQVKNNYDLVIFDTPSVLECADSALIGAETSGMILVSGLGQLSSARLEQTLEKLWISKISVLGIVAREAPPQSIFQI
ncbi:MAG TPA: polysaccharide biosynthesis tyrosine autokinase [Leptolyngbyaceae cyanobacterium]